MRIKTLTIVGVGLIGGSIGLAAKKRRLAERVIGVGRQQCSLSQALREGAVDETDLDLAAAVSRADLSVFCTPVSLIAGQVLASAPDCKEGALLTDAGSTKSEIVRAVEGGLPDRVFFAGSHPLAGSEKKGPQHADADLFLDRLVVVTPTEHTRPAASAQVAEFWRALGARVEFMTPEAHDRAVALTSHLPHLLASALAGILPQESRLLAASGFRDATRLAAGDPDIWAGIFAQNRAHVLSALDVLERQLALFRSVLLGQEWQRVHDLLAHAKKVRDDLGS
jgi:prephenate dehydrogenase